VEDDVISPPKPGPTIIEGNERPFYPPQNAGLFYCHYCGATIGWRPSQVVDHLEASLCDGNVKDICIVVYQPIEELPWPKG